MIDRLLQAHLEPIARDYRRGFLLRRLAWCWTAAGLVGLGCVLLRRYLGWLPPWAFGLLVLGTVLAAGLVAYRVRQAPVDYRLLARQIELEHPELHALLLTAVEQHPYPATGELNYLQQRVIREALEHHRRHHWEGPILHQLFTAWGAQWAALAFLLLVLTGLRPNAPPARGFWAARSHGILVTPGDTSLERGSGLVVLARFEGRVPAQAALVIRPLNELERTLPLTKSLDDPVFGGGLPEVTSDLVYRVESSVGRTRDFKVEVFEYPRLERADARITYPAYTGLAEKTIPDTRRVSAVEGSLLDYTFHLNKPVVTAKLVAKDGSILPLAADTNHARLYHARFAFEQSRRYELVLVDEAGRTNKTPPAFVFDAFKNRPPELKLAFPRGDQRLSALEEVTFQAEASDDFGLRAYGLAYSLAGKDPKLIQAGQAAAAHEKRAFRQVLAMEDLRAEPDQLLSYYLWADDVGPDGQVRRTVSDMFFAEIRPFDEIFREGQAPASGESAANSPSGQEGSPTQKLAEIQKQIISATWNLQRRESGSKPTEAYKKDVGVVHESQLEALKLAREQQEESDDPRLAGLLELAEQEMERAAEQLGEAASRNSVRPLSPALSSEQSAYQALLRLQAREHQVARGRNQRGGGRGNNDRAQRQVDQLELRQTENRYETQRQASPLANPEQREQLQVLNRLKELAQRQQDLNERLKELQTALPEARSEEEREEIRRRLQRLREEQQELLADADELRQRMDRPENQSRMADARQQLDQTRSELQRAAEALDRGAASQALASGTRAQRELQQLRDEFRRRSSGQFAEDMRRMRNDARELAQNQEELGRKMDDLAAPKQKTLGDSDERRALASQLGRQKSALTNLFTTMRQVSEQADATEPLLAQQLYELVRQTSQEDLNKALETSAELVRRGFVPQAGPFEQRARQGIDSLKQGVERAAESVLGDETEALRLAKRELEALSEQLENELAQAEPTGRAQPQNQGAASDDPSPRADQPQRAQASSSRNPAAERNPGAADRSGQTAQTPAAAEAQKGGGGDQANAANDPARRNAEGNLTRMVRRRDLSGREGGYDYGFEGGVEGGSLTARGPLMGPDFVEWSDRLRDVEEMLDLPDLRTEVARVRDRARVVRQDYRRLARKPDWAVVRLQIAAPLVEVRARVAEELARRQSQDALVPIDRDPVPAKFSELVRRYYERLGKSD